MFVAVPEILYYKIPNIQGDFFNWSYPDFAKCRPVNNHFQKFGRVQDWPYPMFGKKFKCRENVMF